MNTTASPASSAVPTPSSYRPEGFTTLTPLIVVSPARAAIDFYTDVFGARVTTRMDGPDGSVWHCELDLGTGRLQVMDPNPQFHTVGNAPGTDDVTFSLAIYVADVDTVTDEARARGARVREEPVDFEVTGDRFASIQDPYGVRWTVMSRITDKTDEEIQQNLDAWRTSME
ncbi:VOC family protein [Georgenia halophila]|uniref:VOC family protein n=1 Tax=Georgenia halophila TaxID=620889 RepID=A0ABP8L296_9MICO